MPGVHDGVADIPAASEHLVGLLATNVIGHLRGSGYLLRRALTTVLETWMKAGGPSAVDAEQIATKLAAGNARRIYPLPGS